MTPVRFSYRFATLRQTAQALTDGEVSPGDVTEEALELLTTLGVGHRALAHETTDRARREAEDAARTLASGRMTPITGIPYVAKDIISARGAPTSWGVPSFIDRVIDEDATVVERLRAGGAILAGKAVTTALAGGGGHRIPGWSAHGQPMNPWDRSRFAGSSSSGSAVAVALGAIPFALGTETGGSVMQPSAFCGVTGYRPTFGRIPRTGTMSLSRTLDKVGVLAHTVDDCATVAEVLWGPDGRDEYVPTVPPAVSAARDPRTLRVGISPDERSGVAPQLLARVDRWLEEIQELAPDIVACEIDPAVPYGVAIESIIRADAGESLAGDLIDPSFRLTDEHQLAQLMTARDMPVGEYIRATHTQHRAGQGFAAIFGEVDLIVSTTFPTQPQLLTEPRPPRKADTVSERLLAAANLAGLPGLSLPCGVDDDGLPVGIHIVGPPDSDATLFEFGRAYQASTDHHRLRPP